MALRKGNYAEARSYLSQSFQTYNSAFGPNHPQTKKAKELIESLNVVEQTDS
ncbi:MAG: tetratricopeptide repeat protein [Rubrobacter sp.]|nr:tetratricopeptide repeat protein [Rubrobacter sp.]